jgi:uncharacterized membrane protein (UPF0127 family)
MPSLPHSGSRAAPILAVAMALAVGGCNPLPTRTVSLGGQAWVVYEDRGNGMRGLPGFGDADGMLFDVGGEVDPTGVAFAMDGVGFPIDIAWFDGDGVLVGTATMATCAAAPCPLYRADGPWRWAIEAPLGAFADLRPDDRLVVED